LELDISRNGLGRYLSLLDKGGVSESQIEEARARVIQAERGYTSFLASLKTTEISLLSQERSLLDLEEQHHKELERFELDISDNIRTLKNLMRSWRNNYLPGSGARTMWFLPVNAWQQSFLLIIH
jgi:ribosomal protein L11 methylase PrmA